MSVTNGNGHEPRDTLAPYQGTKVTLKGIFDRWGTVARLGKTALIQMAEISTSDGKEIEYEHLWLQNAGMLAEHQISPGDRIRCTVQVWPYYTRVDGSTESVKRYSVRFPSEVEVIFREGSSALKIPNPVPAPTSPPPPASDEPDQQEEESAAVGDPLEEAELVRRTAEQVGGWDRLRRWIDVLR